MPDDMRYEAALAAAWQVIELLPRLPVEGWCRER
jgi:hypothetical protein